MWASRLWKTSRGRWRCRRQPRRRNRREGKKKTQEHRQECLCHKTQELKAGGGERSHQADRDHKVAASLAEEFKLRHIFRAAAGDCALDWSADKLGDIGREIAGFEIQFRGAAADMHG